MQPVVFSNLKEAQVIFEKNHVEKAYLFGSACTGDFSEKSDLDFIIKFKDGLDFEIYTDSFFEIKQLLESLFSRKVDLLTERSIKKPYFLEEINKTKTKVYG